MDGKILIIDDDKNVVMTMSKMLQRVDMQADMAFNIRNGLRQADQNDYDVVLLDVNLPDGNGIDHIPVLLDRPVPPQVIIMTGYSDPDGAKLAIESGAWDYLKKPVSPKDLQLQVSRAIQYQVQKRQSTGHGPFIAPDIIGDSKALRQCLEQSAQIVNSDANVVITGETGTGKELFARAIHDNSARRNGRFVVVDCSVLSENLIGSALFGHQRGSFTGADKDRRGLVELANGGTLFMDEVGELPESIQSAFLRVLQEKTFRPVGSEKEVYSNFRVICATNKDLEQMMRAERFRTDLLFRLKTFVLHLPELKDRKGDIALLAKHLVNKSCDTHGVPKKTISSDFIEVMEKYQWPGNVRELINTIEISVTSAGSEQTLFAYHLPVKIRAQTAYTRFEAESLTSGGSRTAPPPMEAFSHKELIETTEKQYLESLYGETNGNIQQLIRRTGLSRTVLYNKLKKYHIRPGDAC